MSRRAWNMATLTLATGLLAAGCGGDGSRSVTAAGSSQGVVSLRVANGSVTTDSFGMPVLDDIPGWHQPLPGTGVTQLSLTFDTVRLYPACHDRDEGEDTLRSGDPEPCGGEGADSCGYIEFLTAPVTVDAMALADSLDAVLATLAVPAGTYSHLALRIASATAVTDSGLTVPVRPARGDSLLRVMSRFTVTEGEAVTIRVTIDLDRSVREQPPGSGSFVLMPVIFAERHGPWHGGHGPGGHGHGGHGHGGGGA